MDELVRITKVGPDLGSWSGRGLGPCAGARPVGTHVRGGCRCTVANGSEGSENVVSGTIVEDVVVGERILRGYMASVPPSEAQPGVEGLGWNTTSQSPSGEMERSRGRERTGGVGRERGVDALKRGVKSGEGWDPPTGEG